MSSKREAFTTGGWTLPVLVLAFSLTSGCITEPDSVDNDSTNVIVEIVNMQGQASAGDGTLESASDDLFSDVCFSPGGVGGCSVFNDNGFVTMRIFPKDPGKFSNEINSVTFERYRVTYVRADGRNVAGVDVPYPFDGAANFTLNVVGDEVSRGFVVVRHQAKVETPLREIANDLSAILSVLARIDFYGHDGSGRAVTATAYLNVTFADFANAP